MGESETNGKLLVSNGDELLLICYFTHDDVSGSKRLMRWLMSHPHTQTLTW